MLLGLYLLLLLKIFLFLYIYYFDYYVAGGVSWVILTIVGLLRKVRGAVGQTLEVRVLDSAGCASGRPNLQGICGECSKLVVFGFSTGTYRLVGGSWGPERVLKTKD